MYTVVTTPSVLTIVVTVPEVEVAVAVYVPSSATVLPTTASLVVSDVTVYVVSS